MGEEPHVAALKSTAEPPLIPHEEHRVEEKVYPPVMAPRAYRVAPPSGLAEGARLQTGHKIMTTDAVARILAYSFTGGVWAKQKLGEGSRIEG